MTITAGIIASLFLLAGVAQPAQDAPAAAPDQPKSFDLARLKIDQCSGERFDFQIDDGSKVGLCSKAGATKDEVAAMLESAINQLESTDRMRPHVRDQIVAQIRAKLAEVRAR